MDKAKRGVFGKEDLEQSMLDFDEKIEELHQKREATYQDAKDEDGK